MQRALLNDSAVDDGCAVIPAGKAQTGEPGGPHGIKAP
jgi:hypothetical protein